jgi:PIN domain nuclease of toxin-antitoxin system
MNVLLDTHVFLWWDSLPEKLPAAYRQICEDPDTQLYLSMASVWEMQIKIQLGKLKLKQSLAEIIPEQQAINKLQIIPIEFRHILSLSDLPDAHKDPFDRIIIAQAKSNNLPILTVDTIFSLYPVELIPLK